MSFKDSLKQQLLNAANASNAANTARKLAFRLLAEKPNAVKIRVEPTPPLDEDGKEIE